MVCSYAADILQDRLFHSGEKNYKKNTYTVSKCLREGNTFKLITNKIRRNGVNEQIQLRM